MTEQARRVVRGARQPATVGVVLLAVLGAMAGQFAIELGAGRVPVPPGLVWLVPIVNAGLVVLGLYLPSPAGGTRRLE